MSSPLTNIRVFVQWTEQTVFAGEDIQCEITFKNIATTPIPTSAPASLHPHSALGNGFAPGGGPDRQRQTPISQTKNSSASSTRRSQWTNKGHRSTLSLNAPAGSTRPQPPPDAWNAVPPRTGGNGGKGHHRSVSVLSIGASDKGIFGDISGHGNTAERPRGPKKHGRSTSLHIVPRRQGINGGPPSGTLIRTFAC